MDIAKERKLIATRQTLWHFLDPIRMNNPILPPTWKMNGNTRKSSVKSTEIRKKGNEVYATKDPSKDRKVISLYSKSIAYAPNNSEELALAFGNRSAIWFRLQKYDLCLIDIDRALNITHSNNLKQKLSSRKSECLMLVLPLTQKEENMRKSPKINPSPSVPCGADNIIMTSNEKYGRHYVAKRDIRPGEIVMCEKSQFASVDIEQMYLVCSHCLAFSWAGIPCDHCIFTIYCSELCKKEAWSEYHQVLCPMLSMDSLHDRIFSFENQRSTGVCHLKQRYQGTIMIVLRMIITMVKNGEWNNILNIARDSHKEDAEARQKILVGSMETNCDNFQFVYNLSASILNGDEYIVDLAPTLLSQLREILKVPLESDDDDDVTLELLKMVLKRLLKICMVNVFKFNTYDCTCKDSNAQNCISTRGNFLSSCGAFFNHSCDHNVDRIFVPGPRVIFFSNQPIAKGKQLFISYGFSAWRKEIKQSIPSLVYSFSCDCIACMEDWPVQRYSRITKAGETRAISEDLKIFGVDALKLQGTPKIFNRKLFHGCLLMLKFIFESFDRREASGIAQFYQSYVARFLYHSYGESVDLLHLEDYFLTAIQFIKEHENVSYDPNLMRLLLSL
ncbi:hypothetical protein QAD02_004388 [Eretmocerus hayati]|uniref:Uncharacterized protein n=1 Tax=Eretmocerus hayati TaxID=131215 RepID=A0ACC2NQG2_9HYME|nr:hypothetical protein QAD02_004388 [Eretmocerus hayati]